MKVAIVVGTRPEIIKLSCVIKELDSCFDLCIIHTGQNYDYELNGIFFEELGIRKPDYFLESTKGTPAETIGDIISKSDFIFSKVTPDALLVYGDTNSCLCVISAKRKKIPIFHMEAGNRCFDQRVPEEINRKIVDHLSDINLPISDHARNYLLMEGIKPETIIKVGSPMQEVINANLARILKSNILEKEGLKKHEYFIVSIHREENVDSEINFADFIDTINFIAEKYKFPVIVSTHPRTRKKLEIYRDIKLNPLIKFLKPFGFYDYNNLQINALCVISDSGTIFEESSILDLTSVTIRQAHERLEGADEASVIMSGLKPKRVFQSIELARMHLSKDSRTIKKVKDYSVENVSKKISRIILSYTDYINRTVWRKDI